jgi:hypothetical protein
MPGERERLTKNGWVPEVVEWNDQAAATTVVCSTPQLIVSEKLVSQNVLKPPSAMHALPLKAWIKALSRSGDDGFNLLAEFRNALPHLRPTLNTTGPNCCTPGLRPSGCSKFLCLPA